MPLSKGLTFQDFVDERDRAKRTLVRKQDNLAGVRSIQSKFEGRPIACNRRGSVLGPSSANEPGYIRGATAVRMVTNSSAAVG